MSPTIQDKKTLFAIASLVISSAVIAQKYQSGRGRGASSSPTGGNGNTKTEITHKKKLQLNAAFLKQLKEIIKICVPTWKSKTVLLLALHSVFLVLRTYLSVVVAKLDGRLVKNLVAANGREFSRGIVFWFLIALPATYTNSMIKYLQSKLAIAFRTSLTKYTHELYLSKRTYYKANAIDQRLSGLDQLMTTDITRFTNALASLYSNLGKPILDILIFNIQLSKNIGATGMGALLVNYFLTFRLLRAMTPAFGKLAAEEAQLEGEFRSAHSRLLINAEEVAFYHGSDRELGILQQTYKRLIQHVNKVFKVRIGYNMFEDFIIKYTWSAVGLLISAVPVFFPEYAGARTKKHELAHQTTSGALASADTKEQKELINKRGDAKTGSRTQGFITNKRLMINLADAGGRIMYSYKELAELAGYTSRVWEMISVLRDLSNDKYADNATSGEYKLNKIEGKIVERRGEIVFEHVPVVTPMGEVLLRDLNFHVSPGDHLMITGPNGAGKTSIMRIISGLWPLFTGTVHRPPLCLNEIMFLPQRPYLSLGTLRDQIIYPDTPAQMQSKGKTDKDLLDILKTVFLAYIPEREGGLNTVKEWKDVFSGGEKQRMQLARIFYHSPKLCILDESTSAVSVDVEGLLYSRAKDAGITIVTISHRPALFKYHHLLLNVGQGVKGDEWTLERIAGTEELVESVEHEIKLLEEKLKGKTDWQERLEAINKELSLQVNVVGDGGKMDSDLKFAKRTLV